LGEQRYADEEAEEEEELTRELTMELASDFNLLHFSGSEGGAGGSRRASRQLSSALSQHGEGYAGAEGWEERDYPEEEEEEEEQQQPSLYDQLGGGVAAKVRGAVCAVCHAARAALAVLGMPAAVQPALAMHMQQHRFTATPHPCAPRCCPRSCSTLPALPRTSQLTGSR
jgi:hypothetical protein